MLSQSLTCRCFHIIKDNDVGQGITDPIPAPLWALWGCRRCFCYRRTTTPDILPACADSPDYHNYLLEQQFRSICDNTKIGSRDTILKISPQRFIAEKKIHLEYLLPVINRIYLMVNVFWCSERVYQKSYGILFRVSLKPGSILDFVRFFIILLGFIKKIKRMDLIRNEIKLKTIDIGVFHANKIRQNISTKKNPFKFSQWTVFHYPKSS